MKKILWIGPNANPTTATRSNAVSLAAIKWQDNLIQGLLDNGIFIDRIQYLPEQRWPLGSLLPRTDKRPALDPDRAENLSDLEYLNTFFLRNLTLRISLRRKLKKKLGAEEKAVIFSYNAPLWLRTCLSDYSERDHLTWICIVADRFAPESADAYVFLSYGYYKAFGGKVPKLHLDGGIYPVGNPDEKEKLRDVKSCTVFLYSGSLTYWGGIHLLLDALSMMDSRNFELQLTGKCMDESVLRRVNLDPRINYLGVLDEDELRTTYTGADVFLNPRPTGTGEEGNNFPSKLFDYLGWGKPILSTWSHGLAPEYKAVLNVVRDDPREWAKTMLSIVREGTAHLQTPSIEFLGNKTWTQQARNLVVFVDELSNGKHVGCESS